MGMQDIWVKRPMLWITMAYILGVLISINIFLGSLVLLIMAASLLCISFILIRKNRWQYSFPIILIVFMLVGILNCNRVWYRKSILPDFADKNVTVQGQIIDFPHYGGDKDVYVIKTRSIVHGQKVIAVDDRIYLAIYKDKSKISPRYHKGDILAIRGSIAIPPGRRNPKCFDYRAFLKRQGINATMGVRPYSISYIGKGKINPLEKCIYNSRIKMERVIDSCVGDVYAKFIKTIILGERWLLPSDISEDFAQTGLAHILSISGLHVGFILAGISFILDRFYLSRISAFSIKTFIIVLYCALIGAPHTAIRSTIMAIVYLGGQVLDKKADPLNTISIAAFCILLLNPLAIMDVGFQLSFIAVLGIISFYERFNQKFIHFPRYIRVSISTTLAAQIGVWPIIAYNFNTISPISLIANIVLVPLAGLLIILSFLFIPIITILPIAGNSLGLILSSLCNMIIQINRFMSNIPLGFMYIISLPVIFIICYYVFLFVMSKGGDRFKIYRNKLLICLICVMIFSVVMPFFDHSFKVVFVDVGQGDCIYIRTPDRKNILVDGGGRPKWQGGDFDVGKDIVVPFLLKNGVGSIDLMVASHGHDDHIGGLVSVAGMLPVKNIMYYPSRDKSETYNSLMYLSNEKKIKHIRASAGQRYKIGQNVYMDVLYPPNDQDIVNRLYEQNENNLSLVLLVQYGDSKLLLTGDIEQGVERYLASQGMIPVDILKVPHHGSSTSSSEDFLNEISPKGAIIQVGKNNFGHPNPEVINRLEDRDVAIFRNDINGAIICTYKKGKWVIHYMLGD